MADERNSHLLYLVRHGQARTQGDDADRTLTDQGQGEIEMIARWAAGSGVEPAQIRHSGKRRAEQTATILQDRLSADEGVVVGVGLSPNDDVRLVAETLERATNADAGRPSAVSLPAHLAAAAERRRSRADRFSDGRDGLSASQR